MSELSLHDSSFKNCAWLKKQSLRKPGSRKQKLWKEKVNTLLYHIPGKQASRIAKHEFSDRCQGLWEVSTKLYFAHVPVQLKQVLCVIIYWQISINKSESCKQSCLLYPCCLIFMIVIYFYSTVSLLSPPLL